jgi:hypothetical protein
MQANALPKYDARDNPTGCCPRFDPAGWDGQDLNFADKPFITARTKSVAHVPLDMAKVFRDTFAAIERAKARDPDDFLVLSRDRSPGRPTCSPSRATFRLSGRRLSGVIEQPCSKAHSNACRSGTRGRATSTYARQDDRGSLLLLHDAQVRESVRQNYVVA